MELWNRPTKTTLILDLGTFYVCPYLNITRYSSNRSLMIFKPGLSISTKNNKKVYMVIITENILQVIEH